jgi:hypothetical protein
MSFTQRPLTPGLPPPWMLCCQLGHSPPLLVSYPVFMNLRAMFIHIRRNRLGPANAPFTYACHCYIYLCDPLPTTFLSRSSNFVTYLLYPTLTTYKPYYFLDFGYSYFGNYPFKICISSYMLKRGRHIFSTITTSRCKLFRRIF